MRLDRLSFLSPFLVCGVIACTGPTGPQGPPGDTGGTGASGSNGSNGATALTRTTVEPAGTNCANGGIKIDVGVDTNGNGILDDSEVTNTTYVCNGSNGNNGSNGSNGSNGENSLVRTSPEAAGANCPYGGTKIETGLDANGDGVLQDSEVNAAATSYVCNTAPSGTIDPSTGINATIKSVSTTAGAPITVRFTLKDDRNFPLDINGLYSVNTTIQPRFAIGWFSKDATTGFVSPLTMYTQSTSTAAPNGQPTNYNPATGPQYGTLVENGWGAGDYTYTFPTTSTTNGPQAVAYDSTKLNQTHVVWMQVTRQTDLVFTTNANTFYAANPSYNFVPDGSSAPLVREIASQQGCNLCHNKFKAETTASAAFHGGGRVDVGMCNVCHNPGRTTNPSADSKTFIHRIHNGQNVQPADLFHGIAATYPRDIRDCNTCHGPAQYGGQALANPTIEACTGCHDYVKFDASAGSFCGVGGALQRDANGIPVSCNHIGGAVDNTKCATCHALTAPFPTAKYHVTVEPPDPNNIWSTPTGGNANTNASYLAALGLVPQGANKITYVLKSVDAVADATIAPNKRPQITFKLQMNGADVVFQDPTKATEIMANYVGSPSVYFVWSLPQDGITAPADFNASASGYIRNIWNNTATGTGVGTLSGPDSSGYYTIKLTNVQIASNATMLTGGVGYSYSLSSAPPLVQTNVAGYGCTVLATGQACTSSNITPDGKIIGGLSVPAANVWKVATGFTGRRAIVDNAKCLNCHGALGVQPTFHAGQRNDGPTCSFCHNPQRTSSGWAAGSRYYIHAIHGGRQRTVPFTWHAKSATNTYDEIEFPGTLNSCVTCHVPNTFDFTNATNLAAVPNMQPYTVATGIYNSDPLANSTYYTLSPYIIADNVTNYGAGFTFAAATGLATQAAGTTLVISPITTACSACHDSAADIQHFRSNGATFYGTRQSYLDPNGPKEECLICHGPGRVAAIGEVHQH